MENLTKKFNSEAPIAVCGDMSKKLCTAGKFIEQGEAAIRLSAYFKASGTSPKDPHNIFGHTFGLNNIRTMLYNIDQYNANPPAGAKLVKGIRVYLGYSRRDDPDFPMNPVDGSFNDLIFMPVLEDGNDYLQIYELTGTDVILSGSRPCPNECGFCFIDQM